MTTANAQTMLQFASKRINKLENLLVQSELMVRQYQNVADVLGQTLCGMALEAGMRGDQHFSQFRALPPPFIEADILEVIRIMETAPERQEEKLIHVERG